MTARSRLLIMRGALVAVVAAAALWVFLPGTQAQPQQDPAPLAVQASLPRPDAGTASGEDLAGASFAATLHFDREARLAFRVPGRILRFPARIGDRLARGAVVAVLEADPYAAAQQRAAADADRARTSLMHPGR